MSNVLLFEGSTVAINENTSMGDIKSMLNEALATNTLSCHLIQDIIDWLQAKELEVLANTWIPIRRRNLRFMGFDRAVYRFGCCHMQRFTPDEATISLSKVLKVEDNAEGIINVIAHEVLHGILPYDECHGNCFETGMFVVNEKLGVHILAKGIVGKYIKPKYKYELYCPHCDKILKKYLRKCDCIKHPSNYYCGKCHTTLISRKCKNVL